MQQAAGKYVNHFVVQTVWRLYWSFDDISITKLIETKRKANYAAYSV